MIFFLQIENATWQGPAGTLRATGKAPGLRLGPIPGGIPRWRASVCACVHVFTRVWALTDVKRRERDLLPATGAWAKRCIHPPASFPGTCCRRERPERGAHGRDKWQLYLQGQPGRG